MKKNLPLFYLLILFCSLVKAQDLPFNCDYNAYLFQYNDVYAIDLASGNSYSVATDVTEGNINAAAYNPADGFIWGSLSTPARTIVRIGKNFQTTTYYVDELPDSNRYVGDISNEGVYYLKGGGTTYYKIDLNPESENYSKFISEENLSSGINVHDWAFNAVDGNLYTVEKKTNILYRINPETSLVTALGEVPILSGLNYTYGAVYFDADGRFYVSANQTGTIYVIQNVQGLTGSNAMESNLFAFGPSSSQNDGARCPTAPVPQEDCINGIDDDGDGLVDCDDPSCSGYASCPVLELSTTSSANQGGLESNNRLSQQISKRNFNRAKSNYRFDKKVAKKLKKSVNYGKASAKQEGLQLADFMPLSVINEDYVVESTPADLVDITNATEVYSADYYRNDNAIASILLLKTENGAYEHTKSICDRLLGAELLSVSTIEIREHSFIKALIKNTNGSIEFVLSLSAKPTENNTAFGIESHWNIDKYETGVGCYNFQIWSNSLDDLLTLGEEVVRLLEVQKPISGYNTSTPPTVFVKKGGYHNGKLELQIVNTNRTESVQFDGGLRATETSEVENVSTTIQLNGNYISNVEVEAGNLFDIGFRIGDDIATPDDLFMSDGPWGYDDAAVSTVVTQYSVEENLETFLENEYPIERNINLIATTSEYVAAYRALTPKFNPIDFSDYHSLKFKAKGTGTLIIRLVKESVSDWEAQYKASIDLTENLTDYDIDLADFKNSGGESITPNDITSLVFTMIADSGVMETKELQLKQMRFAESSSLSVEESNQVFLNDAKATPNPMHSKTTVEFTVQNNQDISLMVYNPLGILVKQQNIKAVAGKNNITIGRDNLSTGMYLCHLKGANNQSRTIKLLMK